jgi:hypothetical protein
MNEKLRFRSIIAGLRSKEISLILHEESTFHRRKELLATVLEVLLGAYAGIISIFLVIVISRLFS